MERRNQLTENFVFCIDVHECVSQMHEKVFTCLCTENNKIN